MRKSIEWLDEVKSVPGKLEHWLERQYIGEMLAAERILALAQREGMSRKAAVLTRIASDESKHAAWVGELLTARGIELPVPSYQGTRYWGPVLKSDMTVDELTAAGYHAEVMRLDRISLLANDPDIDEDVRAVFAAIKPDEMFHAAAFAAMSSSEAIESAREAHQAGLDALGLVL